MFRRARRAISAILTRMTRALAIAAASCVSAAALSATESARAAVTITFPFEDERFLQPGEREGGLAWVPSTIAEEGAPLVVFLHGTNDKGPLHRWFGAPGIDLRKTFEELVVSGAIEAPIVAAPSQTKDAWTGSRLWSGFELAAFVDATARALPDGVTVDTNRIYLVGHSGAGCNPAGGLLGPRAGVSLRAIVAIDTCMDAKFGELLAGASDAAPVFVEWQPTWTRELDAFQNAFADTLLKHKGRRGTITKHDLSGDEAHDLIVPTALSRLLPQLLPPRDDD